MLKVIITVNNDNNEASSSIKILVINVIIVNIYSNSRNNSKYI